MRSPTLSNDHTRRDWLRQTATASLVVAGIGATADADEKEASQASRKEGGSFDVIVCGAGPAGVSAAIAAARHHARVLLIEAHGCLGGVWTSGMLSYVIDSKNSGFNQELIDRLDALNARKAEGETNYVYDVESMKFVLESLVTELKIKTQIHTRVVDVLRDGKNRINGIVTESKSGRQMFKAGVVIDTTGDGDVAALARCSFEIGKAANEIDCPCQPMSLMGIVTAKPETLADFDTAVSQKNKKRLLDELNRAGIKPSYTKPTLWYLGGAVASVMLNHEYAVRPDDAAAITEATFRARAELYNIARALREMGGKWEGTALVATAEQIGIRDGRRVKGRDTVVVADVIAGRTRADAVCRSGFCVDVHGLTKDGPAYGNEGVRAKPFDIPLGSLVAAEVDGLMIAGRCISGDFFAHASYRVTGNAVATGEAAGIAASMAAKHSLMPHQLETADVIEKLNLYRSSLG